MPRKDIIVDFGDSESASKDAKKINDLVDNKGWRLKKSIPIPNEDNEGNKKPPLMWNVLTKGERKKNNPHTCTLDVGLLRSKIKYAKKGEIKCL